MSLRGSAILAAARILSALPERPLVAAAESLGELWYRAAPDRAAQTRANLRRVCEGLAAQARGTAFARRAATDPDALELMVRRCFRHAVRYYLEVARTGSVEPSRELARIDVETPDEVRDALLSGAPIVLVGMHFGALEMPAAVVSSLVGHRITAPMEAVDDPAIRHWFETSRGRMGVTIVPIRDARRALVAALRRHESIGIVNDRDVSGTGIPVPFFGALAPVSPAPALLALEGGTPVYVGSARRLTGGRYAGKLVPVPLPADGTRREKVTALTAGIAGAFETILADAPEQWWGAMHPIWPDLAISGAHPVPAGDGAST